MGLRRLNDSSTLRDARMDSLLKGSMSIPQTVVLSNGKIIKTRSRAGKSAAGPGLTKLFIGAEGTLGIVTEGAFESLVEEDSCSLDPHYLSDGEARPAPQHRCCCCPIP